ncbi:MAG: hypothetical protein HY905_23035 [Deltaproteobacteria bacterium]|nr:hypothetical protein [Deltaproteobacteria bacterium]
MSIRKIAFLGALILGVAVPAAALASKSTLPRAAAAKIVKSAASTARSPAKDAPAAVIGKLVGVQGGYLKVQPASHPATERSVQFDSATVFTLDGRAARAADLRAGMSLQIWEGSNGKATIVKAMSPARPASPSSSSSSTRPRTNH